MVFLIVVLKSCFANLWYFFNLTVKSHKAWRRRNILADSKSLHSGSVLLSLVEFTGCHC